MPDTVEIALGGRRFQIRKLTLRQLRDIEIGDATGITIGSSGMAPPAGATAQEAAVRAVALMEGSSLSEIVRARFDRDMKVILAGVSRDYPDVTEDSILNQDDLGSDDLQTAATAIRVFSGLKLAPVGEGPGTPSQTGTTSTGS